MSGKPHYRFVTTDIIQNDLAKSALEKHSKSNDQLRSAEAAKNSMRHKLNYDPFYMQFKPCVDGTGSDHGIGDPCGLLRESAACLICRYRARHHKLDHLLGGGHFTNRAQMVTIIDWKNLQTAGGNLTYQPSSFQNKIRILANEFRSGLKAVGFFEVALIPHQPSPDSITTQKWSFHWHVIIEGPEAARFIEKCKTTFSEDPRQVVVSRPRRNLTRLLCYVTKSPFSRRQWKRQPTGKERLELDKFYHKFSMSDLVWTTSNLRIAGKRRIKLSAVKAIAATQILASRRSSKILHPALRLVRPLSRHQYSLARNQLRELGSRSMAEVENGLLSSGTAPKYSWAITQRLIVVRLRVIDQLEPRSRGVLKSRKLIGRKILAKRAKR